MTRPQRIRRRVAAFSLSLLGLLGVGLALPLIISGCDEADPTAESLSGAAGEEPFDFERSVQPAALVTEEYVSDERCIACHREAHEGFQDSGMCVAMVPATAEHMIEDFDEAHIHHAPSDRHYVMSERDGRYYVKRYQVDEDGQRYNVIELPIDYILGSGAHSRTYIYTNPFGEYHQFPLAWNPVKQTWRMHPGFNQEHHSGIGRRLTRDCFACHNAYPEVHVGSDVIGQVHTFPEEVASGIGCQRCHGPGSEHVRLAMDPESSDQSLLESIVRPQHLEQPLKDDVCLQCHLQPASRLPSRMPRFGKGAYDYQAGEPLPESIVHITFGDEEERIARFESNHHPYRMHLSPCFTESGGTLSCLTCHDPHHRPAPDNRDAHYRQFCFECHTSDSCHLEDVHDVTVDRPWLEGVAADECLTCHMPRRRTQDVVFASVRDHYIQRFPPVEDPMREHEETLPTPGEPHIYFPDRIPEEEHELYLAIAAVEMEADGAIERLQRAIEAARPSAVEPYAHLATALIAADRFAQARPVLEQVIEIDPTLPIPHFELGRALTELGQPQKALEHFDRALELEPGLPDAHYGRAVVFARLGDVPRAVEQLEIALEARPHDTEALASLALLMEYQRNEHRAMETYRKLLAIDPYQIDAYLQLGMLELRQGDAGAAAKTFRRGISQPMPANPPLHEALAAALLLDQQLDPAGVVIDEIATIPGHDPAALDLLKALLAHHQNDAAAARQHFLDGMRTAQRQRQQRAAGSPVTGLLVNTLQQSLQPTR